MTGQIPLREMDGKWKYTSAAASREAAGFLTMEEYVRRCQNMVAQYIATQSLLDLWEGSERAPGARAGIKCWEQAGINLSGAREAAGAVAEEEEGEE